MPKFRSPVLGFNHNIRHKGWMFHVQTEDSGIQSPHIYTHLFHEGVIIASKKLEYDAEADGDIVKTLMQAQHKSVMKELKHGAFDDKIVRYLGTAPPSAAEGAAIPTDISGDEAAATIPTNPPAIDIQPFEEASASSSLPYIMMDVVSDQGSAVVSGTLNVSKSAPVITISDEEAEEADDDDINGLLNRLRADTPPPELIEEHGPPHPPPLPAEESPGAWLVSRPGQKERPFDKSGGVPVEVGDEVARRILTPPSVDVSVVASSASAYSQHSRKGTLAANPVPAPPVTPPVGTPTGTGGTRRGSQPPAARVTAPQPAVAKPPSSPPGARPIPTAPTRAYAPVANRPPVPPPIPRTNPPPPVLPRPVSQSASAPAIGRTPPAGSPSGSRSQPLPPVLPRGQQPSRPPAPTTNAPLRSQPIHVGPRRSSDSVVVARPAVVIGAPPTVIGASEARRPHGREPTPPPVQPESIFGQDLISEKSLDEVIMAYLSEDSNDD